MPRYFNPYIHNDSYVFCSVPEDLYNKCLDLKPLAMVRENEGVSFVIREESAKSIPVRISNPMKCISLNIKTDLEEVGISAKISQLLAQNHISCNIVAGYHHDHILVPKDSAQKAARLIQALSI